jgi:peptidoglycan hydrolase-like protein with peptidoglycan-binding domain
MMRSQLRFSMLMAVVLPTSACTPGAEPLSSVFTAPAITPQTSVAPAAPVHVDVALVSDEHAIQEAQRALMALSYDVGKADGSVGPATRRAILAFQKDHGLVEDGRLSFALTDKLKVLLAEAAPSGRLAVQSGDTLVYADGEVESVAAPRSVAWNLDATHPLVAIRPSVAGWPAAARAGLDWAITHALDMSTQVPLRWSSTGVNRHFEIQVFATLTQREAEIAGGDSASCRRLEMRADEPTAHYLAIACRDAEGWWHIPHSTIRFARPATALGRTAPATPQLRASRTGAAEDR